MELSEFFGSDVLAFPKKRKDSDSNYLMYLNEIFEEYISNCNSLRQTNQTVINDTDHQTIRELCDTLLSSAERYLDGFPAKACGLLSDFLDKKLELYIRGMSYFDVIPETLYRIREVKREESASIAEVDDIFHIPFQNRHKVSMKRFWVPGMPMLYLGGSIYVCWEEMARPPFDTIHLSAFRLKKSEREEMCIRVINLGVPPHFLTDNAFFNDVGKSINDQKKFIKCYIVCWPLMAACSVKASHRNSPFIADYIIPQMLLEWARSQTDYSGICYYSSHCDTAQTKNPYSLCNYVFWPNGSREDGPSPELIDKFDITKPRSWQMILAAKHFAYAAGSCDGQNREMLIHPDASMYFLTDFGIIEEILNYEQNEIHRTDYTD